jgi:hypothetical protein
VSPLVVAVPAVLPCASRYVVRVPAYQIAVDGGYAGTEEEWLASLEGAKGEDGSSAYQIAVDGGYTGTEDEWLESLVGATGKNNYELAVEQGFTGTIDEYLESLKGEDGQDIHYDAVGEITELDAYAYERAGFIFARGCLIKPQLFSVFARD